VKLNCELQTKLCSKGVTIAEVKFKGSCTVQVAGFSISSSSHTSLSETKFRTKRLGSRLVTDQHNHDTEYLNRGVLTGILIGVCRL